MDQALIDKLFLQSLRDAGLPTPLIGFHFHPTRKYHWDFCWPDKLLAVEKDGGLWSKGKQKDGTSGKGKGAHGHPLGIIRGMEKGNAAAPFGWRVMRYQPDDITKTKAIDEIVEAYHADIIEAITEAREVK